MSKKRSAIAKSQELSISNYLQAATVTVCFCLTNSIMGNQNRFFLCVDLTTISNSANDRS